MSKLNHIITDADVERLRQKREYDVVINERDMLGTQARANCGFVSRPAFLVKSFMCSVCFALPFTSAFFSPKLIRRNDELALLYEKIKIQQSSISVGETGYRDRLEDLRVLKLRANALRRELQLQRAESNDLEFLRAEVGSFIHLWARSRLMSIQRRCFSCMSFKSNSFWYCSPCLAGV